MNEKRKSKRLDLDAHLSIKRLDNAAYGEQEATVDVTDISKTGIGFDCSAPLTLNAVYEAFLTIWTIPGDDGIYHCGGIFIGMSPTDASRIEIYDMVHTNE